MATAGTSWGTVIGRGRSWPWALRRAYASMIGAKSVPAFPKKYSTPRAARSSRYASAVLSMFARLVMGGSQASLQVKSQHPQRVALVDYCLVFGGGPHPLHGGDDL